MQTIADVVYITIFGYIAVIKDLIDCNSYVDYKSFANYVRLIIKKIANKVMIDLNNEKFAVYINAIERVTT